jgi:hypothetical protein
MKIPQPAQQTLETVVSPSVTDVQITANKIIVDTKEIGIWDLINLSNQGGIINFDNRFAIEVVKQSQKWCKVYLHEYGLGVKKEQQHFVAKKIVTVTKEVQKKGPVIAKATIVEPTITEKPAWE